jgi:hypothetical protein
MDVPSKVPPKPVAALHSTPQRLGDVRHFALSDKATGQCLDKKSYLAGADISSSLCNRHTPYRIARHGTRKETYSSLSAVARPLWIKGFTTSLDTAVPVIDYYSTLKSPARPDSRSHSLT